MGRRRAARLAKQQGTAFSLTELPAELWMLFTAFVDIATLPALRLSCTDGRAAVEVVVRDLRASKENKLFLRAQLLHLDRFMFIQRHIIANAVPLREAAWSFLDGIFDLLGDLETLCKELGFDPYFKTLVVGIALWLEAFIDERVFHPDQQSYLYSLDRDREEGKSWTKATLLGLRTSAIFWHASASVGYNEEWDLFIAEKLPAIVYPSMYKKLLFDLVWGPERAVLKYLAYLQHAKNHAGLQAFSKETNESSGDLTLRFEPQEHWYCKRRCRRGLHPAPPLQIVPFQG